MTDPLEFAQWDTAPPATEDVPPERPTEWNGKPIPDNAVWEDDGVTPQLTPSGRIKRARSARSTKSSPTAKAADLASVRADLTEMFAFAALSSAPLLPTVALVLTERGALTADAIVDLAKGNPRMLASIQRVSKMGPVVVCVTTGTHIFAATLLDTGRAPVNNPLAVMTGVAQKYMQIHPDAQFPVEPGPTPPYMAGGTDNVPPYVSKPMTGDITDPEHPVWAWSGRPGPGDNAEEVSAAAGFTPHTGGAFGSAFPA